MKHLIKTLLLVTAIAFIYSCDDSYTSSDSYNDIGTSGSLARFAIAGNYLYTVELEELKIFNISDEKSPEFVKQINPGFGIQTIFSQGNYLFLGSQWGVYIYDITSPENPIEISIYSHIYSCDPVVVSGDYAYSTLNSSGPCGRGFDQLEVINISDKSNPYNVNTILMESPKGLGISGDLLFVCDNGIKVFRLTDPANPSYIRTEDVDANDVIPIDNMLIVTANSGLYIYDINTSGELTLLSTLYSKI